MRQFATLTILAFLSHATWAAQRPVAVSPGNPLGALIDDPCPTFSWAVVEGTRGYQLVVYRLDRNDQADEDAEPVLRQSFAGNVASWTPSLDLCLDPGGEYAWAVRAVASDEEASDWSAPSLFRLAPGPRQAELEHAVAVVRRYWEAHNSEIHARTVDRSPLSSGHSHEALAETLGAPRLLAPAETKLSVAGHIHATSFSGDGALLTGLDPASLSAGTAPIDISGNAATASEAINATNAVNATNSTSATNASNADTLDHLDSTEFATALELSGHSGNASAHHVQTVDTNAASLCTPGQYLDGDGTCKAHSLNDLTPTTTKGDLLVEDGTSLVQLPVGVDGTVLTADSAAATGMSWKTENHRDASWSSGRGPNEEIDWGQLTSRTLTLTKESSDTALKISYTDSFGVSGSGFQVCRWEIRVDGEPCPGGALFYDFWVTSNVARYQSHTVVGFCTGLAAGSHEIGVWVGEQGQQTIADCFTGWNNSTWVLEAEEVR